MGPLATPPPDSPPDEQRREARRGLRRWGLAVVLLVLAVVLGGHAYLSIRKVTSRPVRWRPEQETGAGQAPADVRELWDELDAVCGRLSELSRMYGTNELTASLQVRIMVDGPVIAYIEGQAESPLQEIVQLLTSPDLGRRSGLCDSLTRYRSYLVRTKLADRLVGLYPRWDVDCRITACEALYILDRCDFAARGLMSIIEEREQNPLSHDTWSRWLASRGQPGHAPETATFLVASDVLSSLLREHDDRERYETSLVPLAEKHLSDPDPAISGRARLLLDTWQNWGAGEGVSRPPVQAGGLQEE